MSCALAGGFFTTESLAEPAKRLSKRALFLVAQTVKRLPVLWKTRVRFPGREDPREKEMETHSSTLA